MPGRRGKRCADASSVNDHSRRSGGNGDGPWGRPARCPRTRSDREPPWEGSCRDPPAPIGLSIRAPSRESNTNDTGMALVPRIRPPAGPLGSHPRGHAPNRRMPLPRPAPRERSRRQPCRGPRARLPRRCECCGPDPAGPRAVKPRVSLLGIVACRVNSPIRARDALAQLRSTYGSAVRRHTVRQAVQLAEVPRLSCPLRGTRPRAALLPTAARWPMSYSTAWGNGSAAGTVAGQSWLGRPCRSGRQRRQRLPVHRRLRDEVPNEHKPLRYCARRVTVPPWQEATRCPAIPGPPPLRRPEGTPIAVLKLAPATRSRGREAMV